jgi:epoxyqueuosine reductase
MDYLEKNSSLRNRPSDHLPGARTVIALAMNYFVPEAEDFKSSRESRIARYAWGRDYHKVIRKRLEAFIRYMQALAPEAAFKPFVDTGALLERPFAQRAGLGFVGKNTMLITRGLGSWVFLANIITTIDIPADAPDARSCGECRLCIEACPTEAITAPYQLDARRCIAYLTVELEGKIEQELREKTGPWIFGCDICQDVCPHNTRVPLTPVDSFKPMKGGPTSLSLGEILSMRSEEEFRQRCEGTPLTRTGRLGLLRNACLAAAHLNRHDLIPALEKLCAPDEHPVLREQAAWALNKLRESLSEACDRSIA